MSLLDVDNRREIIDRRAIADRLAALKAGKKRAADAAAILRGALDNGRAEIARRLIEQPGNGRSAAKANAFLHDQLVRLAYEFVAPGEGLALVGIGGTGRIRTVGSRRANDERDAAAPFGAAVGKRRRAGCALSR